MSSEKFHIKGLDALRAIAVLAVIVGHIELLKSTAHLPNYDEKLPFFKYTSGRIGVILFFVLSGFLITTLLFREREKHGDIVLKKFYLRRMLRVWPLYYLILFLSYILIDYSPGPITIVLCLSIFPNVAHAAGLAWVSSPQIWSVGVEEQFYLLWPFVVKQVEKWLIWILFIFVVSFSFSHKFVITLFNDHPLLLSTKMKSLILGLFYSSKFNCLAIGAIAACFFHRRYRKKSKIKLPKIIAWLIFITPFILWVNGYHIENYTDEFYALLFGIVLYIIARHESYFQLLDHPIPVFLGKISYGLYIYHWLIILLVLKYTSPFNKSNLLWGNVVIYGIVFAITIVVSSFSFFYIEGNFLRMKNKLSRV